MNRYPDERTPGDDFEANLKSLRPQGGLDAAAIWQQHQSSTAPLPSQRLSWQTLLCTHVATAALSVAATAAWLLLQPPTNLAQPQAGQTAHTPSSTTNPDSSNTSVDATPEQAASQNKSEADTSERTDTRLAHATSADYAASDPMQVLETAWQLRSPQIPLAKTTGDASSGAMTSTPASMLQLRRRFAVE